MSGDTVIPSWHVHPVVWVARADNVYLGTHFDQGVLGTPSEQLDPLAKEVLAKDVANGRLRFTPNVHDATGNVDTTTQIEQAVVADLATSMRRQEPNGEIGPVSNSSRGSANRQEVHTPSEITTHGSSSIAQ